MTLEPWIPVVLSLIGSGGILTYVIKSIGRWLARREEARAARELGYLNKIDELQKRIFDMQQERIAYEIKWREASADGTKALADMSTLLRATLAAFLKGSPS